MSVVDIFTLQILAKMKAHRGLEKQSLVLNSLEYIAQQEIRSVYDR